MRRLLSSFIGCCFSEGGGLFSKTAISRQFHEIENPLVFRIEVCYNLYVLYIHVQGQDSALQVDT